MAMSLEEVLDDAISPYLTSYSRADIIAALRNLADDYEEEDQDGR